MSRPPFIVGAVKFKSKSEAREHFKAMLKSYVAGDVVGAEDAVQLCALLDRHPEAETKIGCGIHYFRVERVQLFNTNGFMLYRIDGTHTDFSLHTCLDGANDRRDRIAALRQLVEDQIVAFKIEAFDMDAAVVCPFTQEDLSYNHCHVDHKPPDTFAILVTRWLEQEGMTLQDVVITPSQDNQIARRMTDDRQIDNWRAFHKQHAVLRLLSATGNLVHSKKEAKERR